MLHFVSTLLEWPTVTFPVTSVL